LLNGQHWDGKEAGAMPARSRIRDDIDITICGPCSCEEAMFVYRNPGLPLPPINHRVPLDLAYGDGTWSISDHLNEEDRREIERLKDARHR
jgi:hypothetical protein